MAPRINTRRQRVFNFAAAVFIGAAFFYSPAQAMVGLTPAEKARLEYCEAKITKLDPHSAKICLDEEEWLLQKVAEHDPNRAIKFIQDANTLKDLLALVTMHTDAGELRTALAIRLEGKPAVKLGLGPEPEKFRQWVRKHCSWANALVKKAIRTWDTLEKDETAWLKTRGYAPDTWNKLPLGGRNMVLSEFTQAQARKLLNIHEVTSWTAYKKISDQYVSIRRDLDNVTKSKVARHITQLWTMVTLREQTPIKLTRDRKELQKFNTELENIKSLPVSEQLGCLSKFFDNSPILAGSSLATTLNSQRESVAAEKFTDKDGQAASALLGTALLKEIAGTRAGDRITEFFRKKENTLSLKIAPTPGAYATFTPSTKKITFSKDIVQQWMRTNGYTTKDLMTKKEPIKRLARLLSPAFVHEAVHQQQWAWSQSKGLMDPYPHDYEVEAMSVEALYVIEKIKKDPAFAEMLSSRGTFSSYLRDEEKRGTQFLADPREFRRVIRSVYYPNRPSFEAAASTFLANSEMITRELNRRRGLSKKEQDRLEKEGLASQASWWTKKNIAVPKLKTSVLTDMRGYYLHWYNEFGNRITREIQWANASLADIKADKPGTVVSKFVPPPPK